MQNNDGLLEVLLEGLGAEIKNIFKIKSLYFALKVMKGGHRVTMYFFKAFVACMVLTASVFSGIIYNLDNIYFELDIFNISNSLIFLISCFAIYWNLREKRWIETFGLKEDLISLISQTVGPIPNEHKEDSFDERTIEKIIEEILERKFAVVEKTPWRESPPNFYH